ncbi:MAG: HAD family phosphatase [Myxococcota bacterium]|nr:HAD family phosphatase [Myxococcota bacterium]
MPELDAVLFDFGGVFTPSPFTAVADYGASLGIEPGRFVEAVFGPYSEDTDHPWHRVERGEIPLLEAREGILALGREQGMQVDLFGALKALAEAGGGAVREPMVSCVRELRGQGVRTALVTNNAAEFAPAWRPLLPLDELFDAVIDSSEVGLRKPDRRIYELALERIGGVEASRAAFLDDYEGNVSAAVELGLHGVLVGDPFEPALARLSRLIGA